jgi:hypothetical protein
MDIVGRLFPSFIHSNIVRCGCTTWSFWLWFQNKSYACVECSTCVDFSKLG